MNKLQALASFAVLAVASAACVEGDDDFSSDAKSAEALTPACPTTPRKSIGPGFQLGLAGAKEVAGPTGIGATWLRTEFRWDAHLPTKGQTELSNVKDSYVKNAHAAGAKILGVLAYAPEWARDPSCNAAMDAAKKTFCEPMSAADYGKFAGMVARHYKDLGGGAGVHHWEIWNEPNANFFWRPKPNVTKYADMVKAAHDAIKKEDPTAIIVAGATASVGIYNPNDENADRENFIDPRDFLNGIYARIGKGHFEALSDHPYIWSSTDTPREDENWWLMFNDPVNTSNNPLRASLRDILDAHGDRDKNIWVTEFGIPAPFTMKNGRTLTEADQKTIMIRSVQQWQKYQGTGPFLYFDYQDIDSKMQSGNSRLGLTYSGDGTPGCKDGKATGNAKQAYCSFAFLAGVINK